MHGTILEQLERRFGTSPRLNRRQMLRSALAGVAAATLPRGVRGATASAPRILVLGAGFAGLSAALELKAAGCDVTVIEARRRLGGRVRTLASLVPGKTVEAGGELVGLNQPTWLELAQRYSLPLQELPEYPLDKSPIVLNGVSLKPTEAESLWLEMRAALKSLCEPARDIDAWQPWTASEAETLDRRSTAQWIESLRVSPLCRQALTIQLTSINGMHPAWQSFLANLAMVKGGGLEDYWTQTDALVCQGGNQQLAERMADELGRDRLRLGTPVTDVDANPDRTARVVLADRSLLEADAVVLAVPASCYGRIGFDPPLPALLAPQMGTNTKYLAVLARPAWEALDLAPRLLTDGPIALSWHSTTNQPGGGGEVLTLYAGGATADRAQEWSDADRQEQYLAALERVYPGIRDQFIRGQFLNWHNDGFARGSYSFPAPGQVTTQGPLLEQPHGRLHFAGEHCSPAFIGYMEGALQSGRRTALRVLKAAGIDPAVP